MVIKLGVHSLLCNSALQLTAGEAAHHTVGAPGHRQRRTADVGGGLHDSPTFGRTKKLLFGYGNSGKSKN